MLTIEKLKSQVATLEKENQELSEKNKELVRLVTPMMTHFKELSE
jgi:hypothetical protein